MKLQILAFLLACHVSYGQAWMGEVMIGTSAYNGDLTQQPISTKQLNPAVGLNIKYNSGDFVNFRAGIAFERVSGDDQNNKRPDLQARNLSFRSNIIEFNVSMELILIDPEIYDQYPYLFAGIGVFHFNPYTYDDSHKKTYLHPLSTEGEGIEGYGRKPYSLTQPCVPIGFGFKMNPGKDWELNYEFGYRWLFTDYLDDVSKTYVSVETLNLEKGPEAAQLSYRKAGVPFAEEGFPRGNPKVKDYYFFTGIKVAYRLGRH
ncbi:MAG TPA: DUF6089 family protein [Chitinophagaceae bacterium]